MWKKRNVQKRGRKTNRALPVLSFFALLFVCMMGYLVYFVAVNEKALLNNSYNSRQKLLASQNTRGTIFAADGTVLAYTDTAADGTETRIYPYGEVFAHVIGYSTYGKTGVEEQANYYLLHSNAPLSLRALNERIGAKNPGDNVYTTLDVELQEAAHKALEGSSGAVIVTEVDTGKILAMVSMPDYDPNRIEEIWPELMEEEGSGILVNRAFQGLYPPGSTFKILTALEYIRENPQTWQEYTYTCNGYYEENGSRINCYHGSRHGEVGFEEAFARSCNAAFADIGARLEREDFAHTLEELYFNRELPTAFPAAQGRVEAPEDLSADEMLQTAIGQGRTQMSPLQLNMITAAAANGGILYTPYVVDRVVNCEGTVVRQFRPSACGRGMSVEESGILTSLMRKVVEEGTGRGLSGLSYTAAGKTGSAEYGKVKGDSHAWFTGFAPAEEPEICITVIVEGAGSGSDAAVPIARKVLDAYFN